MINLLIIIVRTLILYITVIASVRIMGKRQVGDMQPGELVVTILISEIAAIPIQNVNEPVFSGIMAIITLIALEVLISFICMKSLKFRKIINGGSAIIINNGKLDQKLLKQLRLTVPDLMEVLRLQNVFDINEVSYAVLETNGNLSVLLKPEYRQITVSNAKLKPENNVMPSLIVSDGVIIEDGLKLANKDKKFVEKLLKKKQTELKNVFLLTVDQNGEYNLITKETK